MMSDPLNTIIVVHPPSVDPRAFLTRLINPESPITDDQNEYYIPWTIDNKYYTANVTFQLVELGQHDLIQADGVDVLIYVFDKAPSFIPPSLIKLLVDQPKDIALAIRLARSTDSASAAAHGESEESTDSSEDVFEEVGLELVDEGAKPEEDDERPISPLDDIRQTLMTHLWPSMVRKALHGSSQNTARAFAPSAESEDEDGASEEEEDGNRPRAGPSFPISFDPITSSAATAPPLASGGATIGEKETFPEMQELKAQLEIDDLGRMDKMSGLDRLDMLDGAFGDQDDEQYARLEEWLEGDEEEKQGGFAPLEGIEEYQQISPPEQQQHRFPHQEERTHGGGEHLEDGFEDDFDDFAAFQTAPPPLSSAGGGEPTLTLDPTPLLLHLQSVRAELSGLDEDERRVRAGREVARVMRDLGMDDGLELDDLDDFEDIGGLGELGSTSLGRRPSDPK